MNPCCLPRDPDPTAGDKLIVQVHERGMNRGAGKHAAKGTRLPAEARDIILQKGPWHVQNQLLIVRKLEPNWEAMEMNWSKVLVWVHLKGIPLDLFTWRGIGYVASVLAVRGSSVYGPLYC
ncbi:hypothetical protein PTKIN_Ptkin14bG0120000 [Pterospermum kingtungense]